MNARRGSRFLPTLGASSLAIGMLAACGSNDSLATDNESEPNPEPELELSGTPSPTPLRRLTRFEYHNVIQDVFGLDLNEQDLLPRDEIALGFDNQAGTLSVTDLHVESYLKLADRIAAWTIEEPVRLEEVAGCAASESDCADRFVARLGRRLLRRPLESEDISQLRLLVGDGSSTTEFEEGASRMIAALLQAPEFLYRWDRDEARTSNGAAGDFQMAAPHVLASRLSFLIWGSGPDDELLDAIEDDELQSPEDVRREAERMMADERARRGLLHFYLQWLDLGEFEDVQKDPGLLPLWDDDLRDAMAEETHRFIENVLWEDDGRLETLLTAKYSYVNARLRDLYDLGVPNPDATELTRVEFPDESPRAGLLTHASILSVQSKADQTSPIDRGKFIREQFFCTIPPPPPPTIVVSAPVLDPRKSTRERFEQHRDDPLCAGCHELLDPIGLAFEHFDAIGRYRQMESGAPVDASGYLVETDVDGPVEGVVELAETLSSSEEVQRCVTRQWFRYAFGRGAAEGDAPTLNALFERFIATDGNLQELVVALTQTTPFLGPTPAPEAESEEAP